jgi:hypothetical protein
VLSNAIFKKLNTQGVTAVEWMLWRNVANLSLVMCILVPKRINPFTDPSLKTTNFKWVLGRVFSG